MAGLTYPLVQVDGVLAGHNIGESRATSLGLGFGGGGGHFYFWGIDYQLIIPVERTQRYGT